MKLIVLIFIICIVLSFILSCAAVKPDRQEQGTLVDIDRVANNKAVLTIKLYAKFDTIDSRFLLLRHDGETITYYQKLRGAGKGRWTVGDRYTIHFKENTILKITKNQ